MNETWVETTLGDLLHGSEGSIKTGPFGTVLKAAEYSQSGVPLISVGEIGEGFIRVHERTPRVSPDVTDRLAQYLLQCNDIVFARKGSIDRSARVKRHEAGYFLGSDGIRVRLPAGVCPEFIAYQVLTPRVRTWLRQHAGGSTMPSLNQGILERVEISLPPLDEQRRIAGVLGALDDLIETNQRLMASLDMLAMAVYLDAWDGSATCTIESLGNLVMGQSPPGSTYNEHGQGMVFFQGVRDFGDRYPTPRVYCTAPTRQAQAGDILIAVRAPIGEINVATAPTAIGRGLASLTAEQPALALRALKASESTWAPYQGTGTVFSSISGPDLRSARVPNVQDSSLERALAILDAQHRACYDEAATLRRTRNELLPLLLSGRVSVREVAA